MNKWKKDHQFDTVGIVGSPRKEIFEHFSLYVARLPLF